MIIYVSVLACSLLAPHKCQTLQGAPVHNLAYCQLSGEELAIRELGNDVSKWSIKVQCTLGNAPPAQGEKP